MNDEQLDFFKIYGKNSEELKNKVRSGYANAYNAGLVTDKGMEKILKFMDFSDGIDEITIDNFISEMKKLGEVTLTEWSLYWTEKGFRENNEGGDYTFIMYNFEENIYIYTKLFDDPERDNTFVIPDTFNAYFGYQDRTAQLTGK